jgi:hypothetical protein
MRQEMSIKAKRELVHALKAAYNQATTSEKQKLLDGFVTATGYNRKYAIRLMKQQDCCDATRRSRRKTYDSDFELHLVRVWEAAGWICSKRLIPFLPEFVPALERCGYISLDEQTKQKLYRLSAATADRLLKRERQKRGRSIGTTRAGNMLRHQIPIRTFADWNNAVPGFFEADLVSHNGGNLQGQCVHTLTLTDIASGWTETLSVISKKEEEVLAAIKKARRLLPMELLGLDTDNGGEFLNHALVSYCHTQSVTFTRSREYKKNDQAHVEEKNGSIVRRLVGYPRYEGPTAQRLLASLYSASRLYVNYFQPSLKLHSKERNGARVKKQYLKAKTPCQRLLESNIPESSKNKLRSLFGSLDPVLLLDRIRTLQDELAKLTAQPTAVPQTLESKLAANIAEIKRPLHHKIPSTTKPGQPKKRMGRRFIIPDHMQLICHQLLKESPTMNATHLLEALNQRYPGSFTKKQRPTVDRLIGRWREAHPEY